MRRADVDTAAVMLTDHGKLKPSSVAMRPEAQQISAAFGLEGPFSPDRPL